jgi:hypothetical protein
MQPPPIAEGHHLVLSKEVAKGSMPTHLQAFAPRMGLHALQNKCTVLLTPAQVTL